MKFLDLSSMGSKSMPDIASVSELRAPGLLDWVGMSEIEAPLSVATRSGSVAHAVAKAQAYVNLIDPEAKGGKELALPGAEYVDSHGQSLCSQ